MLWNLLCAVGLPFAAAPRHGGNISAAGRVQSCGPDAPPPIPPDLLHKAVLSGSLMGLKKALSMAAEIDRPDGRGWTALHYAAFAGNLDHVAWLLGHGADVNARDHEGDTPLHVAMDPVVAELIHWGADVNARNREGATPLLEHAAASRPVLELLLRHGARATQADVYGRTPLHHAGADGVRILLAQGADVNARDIHGWTPLHCALYDGRLEAAKVLIAAAADSAAQELRGRTPLEMVPQRDRRRVTALLFPQV